MVGIYFCMDRRNFFYSLNYQSCNLLTQLSTHLNAFQIQFHFQQDMEKQYSVIDKKAINSNKSF